MLMKYRNATMKRNRDPFGFDDLFGIFGDEHFDKLWKTTVTTTNVGHTATESDHNLIVTFDLPGVARKDLNVSYTGQRLIIRSKRDGDAGDTIRSWDLSPMYDIKSMLATLKDGVLTVTVLKRQVVSADETQIEVK